MKKYIVEFIGTYFLILLIGQVTIGTTDDVKQLAPFAVGIGLIALVYAGGHVSAAHYNPAVTLAMLVRGSCKIVDVAPYIAMQIAAAFSASFTVICLKADAMESVAAAELHTQKALLAEALGTFMLVWVILNVGTAKSLEGNQFYGVAIGATVTGMAFTLGSYSGAAFNPAVAVAACVMGLVTWTNLWIFLAANFGAGLLAAVVFRIVEGSNDD